MIRNSITIDSECKKYSYKKKYFLKKLYLKKINIIQREMSHWLDVDINTVTSIWCRFDV